MCCSTKNSCLDGALSAAGKALDLVVSKLEPTSVSQVRITRLRNALVSEGVQAMCVRDTSNIAWLTAFDNVFDSERAHALFVDANQVVLHTDSRYVTACEREAVKGEIVVNADRVSHAKFVEGIVDRAEGDSVRLHSEAPQPSPHFTELLIKLAIEDSISLAEYRQLEKELGASLKETSNLVINLRAIKDVSEIARMKAAQAITDAAFAHIIQYMKPGMTEREVQLELDNFMLQHGASALAFSSIVATGANGALPHAIPGDTLLEAGQCVVLDFGARTQGYCSDMTRTVFLGAPEGRMLAAWETMRAANEAVESTLKPGVTGKEAHELAERILEEGGFGGKMGHGLGHGVGLDIHEEPVLSQRNEKPLQAGNVVTVEPGIYLPGEFGMRLEDFGVITENGFDIFTQSTHELVVL